MIIIGGTFLFLGRQSRSVATEDAKRSLMQKAEQIRMITERELSKIGLNPTGVAFHIPAPPAVAAPGYRACDSFPVFLPNDTTVQQSCFGITDARLYKLGFNTDLHGDPATLPPDGITQNDEALALVLRQEGTATIFDPNTIISVAPPYVAKLDLTNYSPIPPLVFGGAGVFITLPPVPALCSLAAGQTFNERYDLMLASYDPGAVTKNYSMLAGRILCMGIAYMRMPHDYELCQSCMADNGGVLADVANPAPTGAAPFGCEPLLPIGTPPVFPEAYFLGQIPVGIPGVLASNEASKGLVFMPFPVVSQPLPPLDAYLTTMIKVAFVIEDEKLVVRPGAAPGVNWVNPLTNRPYETTRVEINYYLPPENKPCDINLGSCTFNNRQCNR
jgi:hypothetical protein